MIKRVFLIVLDSFGIGELPDAADYGDEGSNTLAALAKTGKLHIPNLISLGLGSIDGVSCIEKTDAPRAAFGRLSERSRGKDTTIGHWEIAGVVSKEPLPTFPDGFPEEVIAEFSALTSRGVLCNKPYSGTKVINDYGEQHIKSGDLIVYTSADSVFQIAAHEDLVPPEKLYEYCKAARGILKGKYGVGRVIARPFIGAPGAFTRTANRHDFSLEPPEETLLDRLSAQSFDVIAVGKISDIFAHRGITREIPTKGNTDGMKRTLELQKEDFHGLCFVNLVDFDMLYGHRNDSEGYAHALNEFDAWLPEFIAGMKDSDALIITADHGCDPSTESTDHSREYVPLLAFSQQLSIKNLGTGSSFTNISAMVAELLCATNKP